MVVEGLGERRGAEMHGLVSWDGTLDAALRGHYRNRSNHRHLLILEFHLFAFEIGAVFAVVGFVEE